MNVAALSTYLNAAAQRRFVLGKFDCVSFAFEAVKIGWDRDYMDFLAYDDRQSAVDRLRDADGLYEAVCEGLGQDLPLCELEPGDLVWIPPNCIGVLMPDYVAVKTHRTIVRVPFELVKTGWKT